MRIQLNIASRPFVELGPLYLRLRILILLLAVVAVPLWLLLAQGGGGPGTTGRRAAKDPRDRGAAAGVSVVDAGTAECFGIVAVSVP